MAREDTHKPQPGEEPNYGGRLAEQQERRLGYQKEREEKTVGARLGGVTESKRAPSKGSRGGVLTKRQVNHD